jgi:UDP-2,4-diacetamido-2,4,6-trideoxy-beta-L-altropyranose hydrolase
MPLQKKILFRADGDSNTGLGHLYRLFALVEILKKQFQFTFVTKANSTKTIFPIDFIPEVVTIADEPKWLLQNFNPSEYLIIADGYQFKSNYQKQIKDNGYRLIYIDDLVEGKMYADVIINHAANIEVSKYQVQPYSKLALGTDYAILRPSFVKAAQTERQVFNITKAFVCFGGADALDLSLKTAQSLLQFKVIKTINIVLGAAYQHSDIENLARKHRRIKIYRNLDENALCKLMQSCQIAIAPSSTIVYELCAIKMPIVSGYFVDNQKNIYKALLEKGAIHGAGDFSSYSAEDLRERIEEVIKQNSFKQYLEAQQQLFDGKSPNRLLQLLNDLFITFKKATNDDMMMVYDWSNDPLVRKNSYNSEPISIENHKDWFFKKTEDMQTLFLIALYGEQPAGIVRYEISEDHSIIGILVAEAYRGKQLSASFLSQSAKYYFKQNHLPIFAYIKEENEASINAFKNAGYSFYKKEVIKGLPSFVYKLEERDVKE